MLGVTALGEMDPRELKRHSTDLPSTMTLGGKFCGYFPLSAPPSSPTRLPPPRCLLLLENDMLPTDENRITELKRLWGRIYVKGTTNMEREKQLLISGNEIINTA